MRKIIILLIITILLLPSVLSFTLKSGAETIYYEPGLKKTLSIKIDNDQGPTMPFRLVPQSQDDAISGILDEIVYIKEPNVTIAKGDSHDFYVELSMPDSLQYGIHEMAIDIFGDDPTKSTGMIRALAVLGFPIKIYSLFPGKYIEARFLRPGAAIIGESVFFKIRVRNIGTEDIESARAKVDVYYGDKFIGSVYSMPSFIPSKGEVELGASLLITSGYDLGEYTANAVVEYDGMVGDKPSVRNFDVGELDILPINISKREFESNKINKFDIRIQSKWNRPADVYASLFLVSSDGRERASSKTQPILIKGGEKGFLPAYLDIGNVEQGRYSLKVILNYEKQKREKEFDVEVIEVVEKLGLPKGSILIGALVLIILILVILLFRKKKTEDKPQQEIPKNPKNDNVKKS